MIESSNQKFVASALPLNWYEVAKLMYESAQALHTGPQGTISHIEGSRIKTRRVTNRPVFLLAAFALENLIKAFLIYENPRYIEGGRLSRELLNGHGLSALQKACRKVPAPIRTRHVFETLEVGVNSWARYPCSTTAARETEERTVSNEVWAEYCKVFELYSRKLEKLLSKRWKGPYGEVTYVRFNDGRDVR